MYHRNLPHWRQDGATYFVTYRLADSLPQCKLDELKELKRERMARTALTAQESRPTLGSTALPSRVANANLTAQESRPTSGLPDANSCLEELARVVHARVERWLDQGLGSCVLKDAHLASLVTGPMHHFDGVRYELGCYVVMPNHVHAVVRPLQPEAHDAEDILGSWKKHGSRRINSVLGEDRGVVARRDLRPNHS